ncbi:MAG: hypothetical protein U0324_41445 [Polyangiales bacterium]
MTPSSPRLPLLALASALALAASAPRDVAAGDRGLYLALVDARGRVEDPQRDALERSVFECGAQELADCRRDRATGGAHDTGGEAVYGVPPGSLDVQLVEDAEGSIAGRRRLNEAIRARNRSLDGVALYRPRPGGGATLVLINLNAGRVTRIALRAGESTLPPAVLRSARRFLMARWSP